MIDKLVSCIVPVHNRATLISECLDSMLAQTYDNVEVIVVDDGSTDRTADVVRGYGEKVRYIYQKNAGPSAARNTGLHAARGEFIAFNDSDDKWAPEKLKCQMAAFDADPELGVCVTHVQNFWEAELADEEASFKDHPRAKPMPGYVSQALLARRSVFEAVGEMDEQRLHGDSADWFLRVEQAGIKTHLLPEVLVYRRMHKDNRSRQHAGRSRDEFIDIVKRALDQKRAAQRKSDQ